MTSGVADRSCWILLQQLLAIGDSERALRLLNAHIDVEQEVLMDAEETCVCYILQQLALLIKATPRYTQNAWASFEDFMLARKQWVSSVTMLADELPVRLHSPVEPHVPAILLSFTHPAAHILTATVVPKPVKLFLCQWPSNSYLGWSRNTSHHHASTITPSSAKLPHTNAQVWPAGLHALLTFLRLALSAVKCRAPRRASAPHDHSARGT